MGSDIFRLEMPAPDVSGGIDVDGDGNGEELAFNFRNFSLTQELRTGLIVGDNVSDTGQLTSNYVKNKIEKSVTKYAIPTVNGGTGQRIFTLSFKVAAGDTADAVTWGDTNEQPGTPANATGESAFFRMQVLERAIAAATEDSARPVKISFGEYINGGVFTDGNLEEDGIEVVIENPSFTYDPADRPSEFTGEMTFIETIDANAAISSRQLFNRDGV
jgi:hypothetical protein